MPPISDIFPGGFALSSSGFSAATAGNAAERVNKAVEATSTVVFRKAGTIENVQVRANAVCAPVGQVPATPSGTSATGSRPRRGETEPGRDTGRMKLSRPVSWFLLAFGVWSWFIWVSFVKNLWNDASGLAFDAAGDPTAYFWVHLLLAVTSFLLGTAVGIVGLRGLRALRREKNPAPATSPAPPGPTP